MVEAEILVAEVKAEAEVLVKVEAEVLVVVEEVVATAECGRIETVLEVLV